ncbi:MAG: serine--tRNA ligase [Sporolactobacillus sp.]
MLDMKFLREHYSDIQQKFNKRGEDLSDFEKFPELDQKRRELISKAEILKARRNDVTGQVAAKKRAEKDASDLIVTMREVNAEIKKLDGDLHDVEELLRRVMLSIPNIPHDSVPIGNDENDNQPLRFWGKPATFSYEPKAHWEIATSLDILDFERAGKVTGSRFVFYKGLGVRLERALISFMLDLHEEEHGYTLMMPPYMVNRASMTGTGQLPKFEEDAFKIADERDYFLIPTAEVPVTNYYRDEILDGERLPTAYAAYSACFRSEAGSAGRDTRGIIRQHQFNKVELVRFVKPEDSYTELEKLTGHAEDVLRRLNLPYRVVAICTGDLGFTAAKKYDLEVWLPSQKTYREISSCSNFEAYQARRANIRFRRTPKAKPEFVHTLNGSGLAVGRTVAAILENYQQEDGSVIIPEVLRPYMQNRERMTPASANQNKR